MLGRPGCWRPVWMNVMAGIVVDRLGVHRRDDAEVVGDSRGVRQQLADPGAALAVLREVERRAGAREAFFWPEVMSVSRWPMRTDAGQLLAVHRCAGCGL